MARLDRGNSSASKRRPWKFRSPWDQRLAQTSCTGQDGPVERHRHQDNDLAETANLYSVIVRPMTISENVHLRPFLILMPMRSSPAMTRESPRPHAQAIALAPRIRRCHSRRHNAKELKSRFVDGLKITSCTGLTRLPMSFPVRGKVVGYPCLFLYAGKSWVHGPGPGMTRWPETLPNFRPLVKSRARSAAGNRPFR